MHGPLNVKFVILYVWVKWKFTAFYYWFIIQTNTTLEHCAL